jgi:hypothetical protein
LIEELGLIGSSKQGFFRPAVAGQDPAAARRWLKMEIDWRAFGKSPSHPKRLSMHAHLLNLAPHFRGCGLGKLFVACLLLKESAHRCAKADMSGSIAGHFDKSAIEEDDAIFGVEHTKALRHLVDCNRVQRKDGAKVFDGVFAGVFFVGCLFEGGCHLLAPIEGKLQISNTSW